MPPSWRWNQRRKRGSRLAPSTDVLVRLQQQLSIPLSDGVPRCCGRPRDGNPFCTMDLNNLMSTNQQIHLKKRMGKMNRFKNFLNTVRTTGKAVKLRGSLIGTAFALTA